ncbi:nuclear protein localization protein 4 homolog isoform X2 [Phlebotomus argentipes]|nr:nuclear protein localization protein 4 homolog isoform X2 [Phlebotomus argentipes]
MSQNTKIILRVQCPEGTKRVEISPEATVRRLYETVFTVFELNNYDFVLFKERGFKQELTSSRSQKLTDCQLKHGDMIFMKLLSDNLASSSSKDTSGSSGGNNHSFSVTRSSSTTTVNSDASAKVNGSVKEDEVDLQLCKVDGWIQRSRDSKLCRHNSNGCCVHCSPLEPWNENYLKEHKIKHLSFHSYIRKLTSGADRGKFVALEDINCRIKSGCRDHPPWPKGICSKCQPSAITLNRQVYRHVDNVMFENPALVERFLNYWRFSGHQRMGFLYGTYEVNADVPLGIRARVAAIYEPPQESSRDSIRLLDDEYKTDVDEIAAALGLRKVGWIFTDLMSENVASGTVKHNRGIDTHFLTAHECILAGHFQNEHPNACKHATNGTFGSKFVTVCVTGDEKNQVHMEGYAVSAQCMALVRDNCLVPTKDAPELGYIKESTDKEFVPDVYYKEKDMYGNEVSRLARPLPVEYLLVDVPASSPLVPTFTFTVRDDKRPFPVENRLLDGHLQDFPALSSYLSQWRPEEFLDAVSDFHLLVYLARMDMLPMRAAMAPLWVAVSQKDAAAADEWRSQEVWRTLETLIAASSSAAGGTEQYQAPGAAGAGADPAVSWTCSHCTFINPGDTQNCEMCSLPR